MTTSQLEQKIHHELRLHRQQHTTATSGAVNPRFIYLGQEEWRAFTPLIAANAGNPSSAAFTEPQHHTYEGAEVLFVPAKRSHLLIA